MKGTSVRISQRALENGVRPSLGPSIVGTIVGESRDGRCWRVHWAGQSEKTVHTYHKSFVEILWPE